MATPQFVSSQLTHDALLGYIKAFLDSLKGRRTQTRHTYDYALREFMRWFELDGRFLFAVDDVCRYKDHLMKVRKLSPASVSTYLNALRQFCEYLCLHELIAHNPAKHIRNFVRRRTVGFDALTRSEVDRLIGAVDQGDQRGLRDTIIIRLMVQYGISEIEMTRLDVRDYVFVAAIGALRIGRRENETKLMLRPDLTALMNQYLAARPQLKNEQPFFLSDGNRTRGMRMTTRGIRARVNRYLSLTGPFDAGSRKITPRVLRHTAAVLMAQEGTSADEIKYRMRLGSLARAKEYVQRGSPTAQIS